MKKIGGYILALAGLIVLASGIKGLDVFILKFIPFLSSVPKTYSMIAGLVLVVVGIILLMGNSRGRQSEEVPIYRGKNIVGYRRGR